MSEPPNALEQLPFAWQAVIAAGLFCTTAGGAIYKFVMAFKADQPKAEHVIIERAEIADMHAFRDLAKDLRPALERLNRIDQAVMHIDANSTNLSYQLRDVLNRMQKMEEKAEMAKEVRDEIARRLEQERRRNHRSGRDSD
ncbi:MAG: hypothetical protein JWM36_3268 [Hyphomicrobiales bacterium]|nr:hypothetical protein [Hyphomicrobiales bacterium]